MGSEGGGVGNKQSNKIPQTVFWCTWKMIWSKKFHHYNNGIKDTKIYKDINMFTNFSFVKCRANGSWQNIMTVMSQWHCDHHTALLVPQLKDLVLDFVIHSVKHCLLFLVKKCIAAPEVACENPKNEDKGWEGNTNKWWSQSGRNQFKTFQRGNKGDGFFDNKCFFFQSHKLYFSVWHTEGTVIISFKTFNYCFCKDSKGFKKCGGCFLITRSHRVRYDAQ